MKKFLAQIQEKSLSRLTFLDYCEFIRVNEAYCYLTSKMFEVVNKMAPTKTVRVKKQYQWLVCWRDGIKNSRPKQTV